MDRITFFLFCCLFWIFGCAPSDIPQTNCDGSLRGFVMEVLDSECGSASGRITVIGTGGKAPLLFSLDGGPFQASSSFQPVGSGLHQITIRDAQQCTFQLEAIVKTGILLGEIRPIFIEKCATPNCHNGERSSLPDFNKDEEILSRTPWILTRTLDGSMPPPIINDSLTTKQLQLIECWANDGGPS